MPKYVNYQSIKSHYHPCSSVLRWLIPGGSSVEGNDYVVPNPRRIDREAGSFRIDIATLRFHDFATGDCGVGVINLAAYVWNCSIATAAERLRNSRPSFLPVGNNSFQTSDDFNENEGPAKERKGERSEPSLEAQKRREFIWSKSRVSNDCEYLRRKGVTCGNARVNVYRGEKSLVVPLTDSIPTSGKDLKVKGAQYIHEDGRKIFKGACKGLFHIASPYDEDKIIILICEGWATATSLASTSYYAIAAMSCENMKNVALRVRDLLPDTGIVIAADNDEAGRKSAEETEEALRTLGGAVQIIYPTPGCKDFNDMLPKVGAEKLKEYVKALVRSFIYSQ